MTELKPCPFCGGKVEMHGGPEEWKPTFYDPDSGGDPYCVCCKCGVHFETSSYDAEEVITAWNRRASEWIPVKDRLPEERGNYLTCDHKGNIHVFFHYVDAKYPFNIGEHDNRFYMVTHWMPLPAPPEGV